jgi:hypothetical protein
MYNLEKLTQLLSEDNKDFNSYCKNYQYIPVILPECKRIIAIGDLHGDYILTINSLKKANLIKDNNINNGTDIDLIEWIGCDTVVVQVGDQIDRCRPYAERCNVKNTTVNDEASDIKILKLLTNLHEKAIKDGGMVISLLGNHELMNVNGNMNYVSYEGIMEFVNDTGNTNNNNSKQDGGKKSNKLQALRAIININNNIQQVGGEDDDNDIIVNTKNMPIPTNDINLFNQGLKNRIKAFSRGNEYAKLLGCSRLSFVVVGSFIFVHAGIIPALIEKLQITDIYDLIRINKLVRKWLIDLAFEDENLEIIVGSKANKISFFWDRLLGSIPPNYTGEKCDKFLKPVLKIFHLEGMIVGHTPQFVNNTGINATCDNQLWRIDNGGSQAFNNFDDEYRKTRMISHLRSVQVLEIIDNKNVKIISQV